MARRATERVGVIQCNEINEKGEVCGTRVHVRRSETGALSYTCPECETSKFLRVGTPAHAALVGRLGLNGKAPAADPAQAPAAKPKTFGLGDL